MSLSDSSLLTILTCPLFKLDPLSAIRSSELLPVHIQTSSYSNMSLPIVKVTLSFEFERLFTSEDLKTDMFGLSTRKLHISLGMI